MPRRKTAEQRIEERCVLREEQQRARLLPGRRKFAQRSGNGAGTLGKLTPGPAVDTAAVVEEGKGAIVRPGASALLQPMRDGRFVHAGVGYPHAGEARHRPPVKAPARLSTQAAACLERPDL